jgi:hypothetical protein
MSSLVRKPTKHVQQMWSDINFFSFDTEQM